MMIYENGHSDLGKYRDYIKKFTNDILLYHIYASRDKDEMMGILLSIAMGNFDTQIIGRGVYSAEDLEFTGTSPALAQVDIVRAFSRVIILRINVYHQRLIFDGGKFEDQDQIIDIGAEGDDQLYGIRQILVKVYDFVVDLPFPLTHTEQDGLVNGFDVILL